MSEAARSALKLGAEAQGLIMELVQSHAPEATAEMREAIASKLSVAQAGVLKRLAQTDLLRSGFEADGEPTKRGLVLEEILNALYRQFPTG